MRYARLSAQVDGAAYPSLDIERHRARNLTSPSPEGSAPRPSGMHTHRWRGLDSNYRFRAEIRFGLRLPDGHRVPWPVAAAATPSHHPARFPSLGARRRRLLPRPYPSSPSPSRAVSRLRSGWGRSTVGAAESSLSFRRSAGRLGRSSPPRRGRRDRSRPPAMTGSRSD